MNRLLVIFFIMLFTFASGPFAQKNGMGRKGAGNNYNRLYDVNTVQTISGEVIKVENIVSSKGASYVMHLVVKTAKETISVHLGPAWFMNKQKIKISPKDKITVTGSRVTYQGSQAIIASELSINNETILLRDANGYPLWSGLKNH